MIVLVGDFPQSRNHATAPVPSEMNDYRCPQKWTQAALRIHRISDSGAFHVSQELSPSCIPRLNHILLLA